MKRKIAIAFTGLLLMLTASFAPMVQAPVPGVDMFVTMGGKVDGRSYMYVQNVMPYLRAGIALPLNFPFGPTRDPLLKPLHLLEQISFAPPVDVNDDTLLDIIPIQKVMVNPIVHYQFIAFRAQWWRFTLMAIAPGSGVIFINPMMPGDVDCYTFNNDTGVFWDAPSQLAGQFAAASGGYYDMLGGDWNPPMAARFPSGGLDGLPGTRLWGDIADGFGDGQPDPPGSSILMLPLVMFGDEYNATTGGWDAKIFVPMPLILTTGVAYDHVVQWGATGPEQSFLYCTNSTEVGMPWEFASLGAPWDDPKAFVKVTYVAAWSNLKYSVNPDDDGDGVPNPEAGSGFYYTIDAFWEYVEKKVREDVVIADINCDQKVTITDIVIGATAFGTQDEGLGLDGIPGTADDKYAADPNYDPRADLDCNGLINIIDLVRIAIDFGKTIDP